jgi:monodechloroaminopyrrolnitrin synthase PrnB-like protein
MLIMKDKSYSRGNNLNKHVDSFDRWIRGSFVEMNTQLEHLYYAQEDRAAVKGVGDSIKAELVAQGREFIVALLAEGNTRGM